MESSLYHFASGLGEIVGVSACEEFHFLHIHISSHTSNMEPLLAFEQNVSHVQKHFQTYIG